MKVDSNSISNSLNVNSTKGKGVDQEKAAKENSKASAPDIASSAKVNFSDRAQQIAKAKELATPEMDTIREDKVAHFQKMIDEGKYQMDAAAIADRMVDEHLMS